MKKYVLLFVVIGLISLTGAVVIDISNPGEDNGRVINLDIGKIISDFLDLLDTPTSYSGAGGDCVVVNSGETGLTFGNCTNSTEVAGSGNLSWNETRGDLIHQPLEDQRLSTTNNVTFTGLNITNSSGTLAFYIDENGKIGINTNPALFIDIFTVTGNMDLIHTAENSDDHALEIDVDAAGFGDVKALDINYITGAISTGEDEGIILININELAATGGEVFGVEVLSTEGSAEVFGFKVGPLIGPIHQDSGVFINPTTATNNTVSTDISAMLDGSSGTNTTIFETDNSYILIGNIAPSQDIELVISTGASGAGIMPTFQYSTSGSHQFTTFTPVDGTNGFRNTGIVSWDDSDLVSHTTNDDTSTFDIKIIRTRNNLAIPPVLDFAKTASTVEYIWDKDGNLLVNSINANSWGNVTITESQVTDLSHTVDTNLSLGGTIDGNITMSNDTKTFYGSENQAEIYWNGTVLVIKVS